MRTRPTRDTDAHRLCGVLAESLSLPPRDLAGQMAETTSSRFPSVVLLHRISARSRQREGVCIVHPDMPQAAIPPPQHSESLAHSMHGVELSDFGGPSQSSAMYLKRSASHTFEEAEGCSSRKRLKEDPPGPEAQSSVSGAALVNGAALADELEQELQCGCCAALVYRPVLVSPCQHFFCGRLVSEPSIPLRTC